jgi:IS5 family transposase
VGQAGDAIHAVLAAAGYNFRRLLAWLRLFLCALLSAVAIAREAIDQQIAD